MLKINFLHTNSDRNARRATAFVALSFTLLVGVLSAVGAEFSYLAATRGTSVLNEVGHFFAFSRITPFAWNTGNSSDDPLSTPDGKLNILLLGIGGEGHDGPQLTDTIIYASYDKQTQHLGLVSIPRDLAYPLGAGRYEKINSVNAYNELQHPGEGAQRTGEAFSKLFNVRIDRVVKIDFKGFADFVDALGGIDIDVQNSFTDRSYPTADDGPNPYQYMTIKFVKGVEHMSGERALQFVRSRHGSNGENSDFARSGRQQLVLKAIRERLLSLGTLSSPKTISDLWTAISSHVQTNLTAWNLVDLLPLAVHFSSSNITNTVLTDDTGGQLASGNVDGAFMLFPKKSDWSDIRSIMSDPFTSKEDLAKANRPNEAISVEVRNGTTRAGFAAQIANQLSAAGYTVTGTGNAQKRGYEKTVIYDLTNGDKPTELARLVRQLNANVATDSTLTSTSSQFLIILGQSSLGLLSAYAGQTNP